jgi:putative DNA primase/helicase
VQFLSEVFAGDVDLIRFVNRAVGYSLTGFTREHAFFVLHGSGKNGKGRFIRQLMALAGDAARTTAFTTFAADRARVPGNTPELAELVGARLVCAGEPDEGVRLSESVIKSLTGEDEITVCRKYENPFSFAPTFKLWLHTNHKPEVRGTDDGIWRRPRLIPFNVSFEGREDLELDAKLDAERPGVLAWAVAGAVEWFRDGLGTCGAVKAATSAYREESDVLKPFVDSHITISPGAFTSSKDLHTSYCRWAAANGIDPWKAQTLAKRLTARGLKTGKDSSGRVRGFVNVQVTE